jgi:hypothetical protein
VSTAISGAISGAIQEGVFAFPRKIPSPPKFNASTLKSFIMAFLGVNLATTGMDNIGGQFLEYAICQGRMREYFREARDLGFSLVEVSDNRMEISLEEKT